MSPLTTAGLPRFWDLVGVAVEGLAPDVKISSVYDVTFVLSSEEAVNISCRGNEVVPLTVMVATAEVVEAPTLSRATAVTAYVPAATPDHEKLYGLVVSDPIAVAPA